MLLQDYLNQSAGRYAENTAVTDGSRSVTYRQLLDLSNSIARHLQTLGVSRQDRVVVCVQRSCDYPAAVLGVLKADAVYVPVDPKAPLERWRHILEDAAPRVLICDEKTLALAQAARENLGMTFPLLVFSAGHKDYGADTGIVTHLPSFPPQAQSAPDPLNNPDDLAYILYTSGSTGRPKGVMISHQNVLDYIDWAVELLRVGPADKVLGTAPFHFDMSTFDLFSPLKAGATWCIASDLLTLFPEKLVTFIEQQQVTLWKGVASLLMYMCRTGVLKSGRMPSLRQVLFAGEALPTKYLIEWMQLYPDKTFYNAYGPTEATGVSCCFRVERLPAGAEERIPIGRPRSGTLVRLLDEDDREVVQGESGEICISGKGLARGYLNDPEKTGQVFVRYPPGPDGERIYRTGDLARLLPDGNLEYLGRKDRQLKYMGYRIEAGEIEQAFLAIPQVKDVAVVLQDSRRTSGLQELVAFWEGDDEMDATLITAELKRRLPPYMIPRRMLRVAAMPRSDRGKIAWDVLQSMPVAGM